MARANITFCMKITISVLFILTSKAQRGKGVIFLKYAFHYVLNIYVFKDVSAIRFVCMFYVLFSYV